MLDQDNEPRRSRTGRVVAVGVGLLVLAVAAFFLVVGVMQPASEPPPPQPEAKVEPVPAPAPQVAPDPEPEPEAPPAAKPRPRRSKPAEPAPAPPPTPTGPVLVIESDVPGASVFVDRQYLGTTPIRVTTVAPGRHQLNASADNEDGIARTIDVSDTGETTVTLAFKVVRLDAATAVVHKHGMGSCEGRLVATPAGLRYETPNRKDAFSIAFKDLDTFEIDYLKKELKVKQRGGKTWNFTDKSENADKLFVFHRDVTKARDKLKAQDR